MLIKRIINKDDMLKLSIKLNVPFIGVLNEYVYYIIENNFVKTLNIDEACEYSNLTFDNFNKKIKKILN